MSGFAPDTTSAAFARADMKRADARVDKIIERAVNLRCANEKAQRLLEAGDLTGAVEALRRVLEPKLIPGTRKDNA